MATNRTFAYVSHAGGREIAVMRLDSRSGDLAMVQRVAVTGKAMPLAVSPDRRFLYAALRSHPYSTASFAIDSVHGTLTHLGDTSAHDSMNYICTDHSGRFLLAALNPQNMAKPVGELSVSAIASDGVVQPAHQVVVTGRKPHAILPDPSNRYVFSTSLIGDIVARHAFDAVTGRFSSEALAPVRVKHGDGPRHLRFHPSHRYMCVINEDSGSLIAYAYEQSTGELNELQTVSVLPPDFTGKVRAADLHFTPDGRFLYASARGPLTLAAFKVDIESGTLTKLATYPTLDEPRGFAIDPQGRYLIVAGRNSNSVACYAIEGETGGLTLLKEYPMGKDPNWVEIVSLP